MGHQGRNENEATTHRANAAISVGELPLVTLNSAASAVGTATPMVIEPLTTVLGRGHSSGSHGPGAGGGGGGFGGGAGDGGSGCGAPSSRAYKLQAWPFHCTTASDFLSHPFELNPAHSVSLRHSACVSTSCQHKVFLDRMRVSTELEASSGTK